MATPLRLLRSACQTSRYYLSHKPFKLLSRNLLSSAYNCMEAWSKSIQNPTFGEVNLSEFAVQIHEQLEKFGRVSAVDINVLSHTVDQIDGDDDEADFVEDILKRYNFCQDSFPPCESTSHAIVRGYLSSGLATRLPSILSDRLTFGIFPNHYTINLIMNHFITENDYENAVKLAYLSTMQEDFSNPINTLLSLEACSQYLNQINIDDLAPPPKDESDGEEDWIKVKYIPYPYYDDHFDITDNRFLLGKTLCMLSESNSVQMPKDICLNLKLIGAGLYHKFNNGLAVLKEVLESDNSISSQAVDYFSESLQKVKPRDANEPEVEIGMRTKDDVIRQMLPTNEEKESLCLEFENLKEKLTTSKKIIGKDEFVLNNVVHKFVTESVSSYELSDIENQTVLFEKWRNELDANLEKQLYDIKVEERVEEMKRQIKDLQEEEELLNYFDNEEKIRLTFIKEDVGQTDPKLTLAKV